MSISPACQGRNPDFAGEEMNRSPKGAASSTIWSGSSAWRRTSRSGTP